MAHTYKPATLNPTLISILFVYQCSATEFENEISCLDINPLNDESLEFRANYLAIGLWSGESLQLVRLPDLHVVAKDILPNKLVPRSLLLVSLDKIHYLMVTLGNKN